ncbi:uncharacterized protein LOC144434423 [Glandiceps talaboti]
MSAILLCSFLLLLARQTVGDCVKINSCSCKFDDGKVIDLTPLAGEGGKPKFYEQLGPGSEYFYSYNPCEDFSEDGDCKDVAVCQLTVDKKNYYDLGDQKSASFSTAGEIVTITYVGQGQILPMVERTSKVRLICGSPGSADSLTIYGESGPGTTLYNFDLSSPHCCPKDAPSGGDTSSGISIGTILLIVVIVLVTVYFVGGILFLKFVKNEEGSDVIPNKNFWVVLPGLIKDGILFAVKPCRKTSSYDTVY